MNLSTCLTQSLALLNVQDGLLCFFFVTTINHCCFTWDWRSCSSIYLDPSPLSVHLVIFLYFVSPFNFSSGCFLVHFVVPSSHTISLSLSVSLTLSLTLSHSLSLSLPFYLSLSRSLSFSFSLSPSITFSPSLSLSLSHTHTYSLLGVIVSQLRLCLLLVSLF